MKRKTSIIPVITAALIAQVCSTHGARAGSGLSASTVLIFPFTLQAEIITPETYHLESWPRTRERYAGVIRGASGRLIRELLSDGRFHAVDGEAPVMPDGQRGASTAGMWPYIHKAITAGADSCLLCDITRIDFYERISHYGFEIYSVHTYRVTASFNVRLVDARTEKIIRTAIVNDSATHRVHRLFWDSIWIHRYTTGPDLAEKLMESAAKKIAREIRR
ncbi:MAG: hypothetical protein KBA61_10665 [Spirochaetes bacterium]|nr:hypothetical protein [Spirochaetota bacterium]